MYKKGLLMLMTAHSPLHPGGSEGVGAIDLPVQRERSTGWPVVHAGGVKGAMRDRCGNDPATKALFGPENNPDHAGALGISEARVLLFPVRSLKGVFAYVTCHLALRRFKRDLDALKMGNDANLTSGLNSHAPANSEEVLVPQLSSHLVITVPKKDNQQTRTVVLEDTGFTAKEETDLCKLAAWLERNVPGIESVKDHLALVSDEAFSDFVRYSTEVITRNRIDDKTGTVEEGALWNEEHLPRETVLYSPIFISDSLDPKLTRTADDLMKDLQRLMPNTEKNYFWVGGDTTVGKGLVTYKFVQEVLI